MRRTSRRRHGLMIPSILVALLSGPAGAEEITLTNGDTFRGAVVERDDVRMVLEHEVVGRIEIPLDKIASVDGAALDEAGDAEAAVPPAKPPREWKSHLEFGGNASFGNTDTQGLHVTFVSVRERPLERTRFDAAYFYGASDGDRDTNKATAGLLQDWYIPDSRWLYFADARYDYDEFQSWEHRAGGHVGLGYKLIERGDLKLTLRGGIGAIREFNSENEDIRPEALLGGDFEWEISDRQLFTLSTTLYPDLDETGEFRWVTSADWSLKLDNDTNLSLAAGLRNEYQSIVSPQNKHNDLQIFAGLQLDF